MPLLNFSHIEANAETAVLAIGQEAVDVYTFLAEQFARGPILNNYVYQFIYRSFYRLDNAGLTSEFKSQYFALLERSRDLDDVDLERLTKELYEAPNRKGQQSLQFSFVTKLANTVNFQYPIYDGAVAKVFDFQSPQPNKSFEVRFEQYRAFYADLRDTYTEILKHNLLEQPRRIFRHIYSAPVERIPDIKVLDFIFWSAGKLLLAKPEMG